MPKEEVIDRGDALIDEAGETADLETKVEDKTGEDAAKELGLEKKEEEEKPEPQIPKSRFDQAVKKARDEAAAATKKADDLEAQIKANQGEVDAEKIELRIDEAEDELEKAIADGNVDKKAALRKEIRQLNRQLSDGNAAAHAARATAIAVEQIRYDALVSVMETEHPELNPDNEDTYDQDMVEELTDYKSAFEAKGLSSSEALKKALKAVYKAAAAKKEEEPEEEVDEEKEQVAKDLAAKKKADTVAAALAAKKKQPPDQKKTGLDSDKAGKKDAKVDVKKLSNTEFDALSEDEKKKLRGDDV